MIVLRQMSRHRNTSLRDNRDSTFRQHLAMKSSNEDALRQTCRNVARVQHIQMSRPTPRSETLSDYSMSLLISQLVRNLRCEGRIMRRETLYTSIYSLFSFNTNICKNHYGIIGESKMKNIFREVSELLTDLTKPSSTYSK